MQISDLTTSYHLTLERTRSSALQSLRAGQLLPARVLAATDQQRTTLQIAGVQLAVRTSIPLTQGEHLLLKVIRPADPLQFQLVREISSDQTRATAARAALPREVPVSDLLDRLRGLVTGASAAPGKAASPAQPVHPQAVSGEAPQRTPQTAPQTPAQPAGGDGQTLFQGADGEKLLAAIQQLLGPRLSQVERAVPAQLRQSFFGSGLFLEATLAAGEQPHNDLKASLLQLLASLRTFKGHTTPLTEQQAGQPRADRSELPAGTPTQLNRVLMELFSQTEGGLARILMNQLASLPSSDAGQQNWRFELPVWDGERQATFDIRIGREPAADAQVDDYTWSVGLDFDLDPLGPVRAHLTLSGDQVSSYFNAENPESVDKIGQALPLLNQAFVRAGFKIGRMVAAQGKAETRPPPPFPLLDEKA